MSSLFDINGSPYITVKECARRMPDISEDVVRDMVDAGLIPVMPREKKSQKILVNWAAFWMDAISAAASYRDND